MKGKLTELYTTFKESVIQNIQEKVDENGGTIELNISLPDVANNGTCYYVNIENITGIEKKENDYLVHNFFTCSDTLEVDEYWTVLRDLSFDELWAVAEKLEEL